MKEVYICMWRRKYKANHNVKKRTKIESETDRRMINCMVVGSEVVDHSTQLSSVNKLCVEQNGKIQLTAINLRAASGALLKM